MQSCRPVLSLHRDLLFTYAAVATVADCKRHAARAVHAAKQLNLHAIQQITVDFPRARHGRMRTESVRHPDTCTTKLPAQKKTKPSSRPSASERRLRSPICRGGPAAYLLSVLELPDRSTALKMAYSVHAYLICHAPHQPVKAPYAPGDATRSWTGETAACSRPRAPRTRDAPSRSSGLRCPSRGAARWPAGE